jgi:short subunit dehydrogenase-like uncharacterized protein
LNAIGSMPDFMIYGATGYTGSLIAHAAIRRNLRPILAGRDAAKLATLAGQLGLEHRAFDLASAEVIASGLRGVHTLLNCAGPFRRTAMQLVDACLNAGVNYLDITGEIDVFEALANRNAEARAKGIVLLPGVGFDVVPSDCLALHLKNRLPSATHLAIAFRSTGRMSRGTAMTAIERIADGGAVRENGKLKPVPTAWKTRTIDFGDGPARAITIPWGDVATAFYSTGIPNIEVYLAAPFSIRVGARLSRWFGWLLRSKLVQSRLRRRIAAGAPGPNETERQESRCAFWAEVTDQEGRAASARQETPNGYDLTVQTALAAVERVLAGAASSGFQTPAMAFGPDFVLGIPGVRRVDG